MSIGDPRRHQDLHDAEFWLAQARATRRPQVKVRTADLAVPLVLLAGSGLLMLWMLVMSLLG